MVILRFLRGFHFHQMSFLLRYEGVVRNGKSTAGHQRGYSCSHCRKHGNYSSLTPPQPGTHQKIIDSGHEWRRGGRASARIMGVGPNTVLRYSKNSGRSRTPRIQPGSDVIVWR